MTKKIKRVSLSSMGGNRPKVSSVHEPQDPISRTAMKVSVFEIEPFEKNPRQVKNEYYQEIKESIREKGLEQPFTITRRPGETKFTTRAGGNTRLMVLRELYEETKEPQFLMVDVYFEPYTKEQDLLISHLTENDLRGNLTLLDRAKGIIEVRQLLEEDIGRGISIRELSESLKSNGYSLGRTVINALIYAMEDLYPVIPEILEAGAGKPVVERIRKTESQLRAVWSEFEIDINKSLFKPVFNESLKEALKFSEKGIEIDEIVRAFETEMALETGIDINSIRLKIAELSTSFVAPKTQNTSLKEDDQEQAEQPQSVENVPTTTTEELPPESTSQDAQIGDTEPEFELNPSPNLSETESDPVSKSSEEISSELTDQADQILDNNQVPEQQVSNDEEDLDLLRDTALRQAILLAEEADISDLVIRVNRGYGFALADLPLEIHFTKSGFNEDSKAFKKVWQIWYQIYITCGASHGNKTTKYSAFIGHENDLKALVEGRFDELSDLGQYLTTAALQFNLPIDASDVVFNKLDQLIKIVRKIEGVAKKQKVNLWEVTHGQ